MGDHLQQDDGCAILPSSEPGENKQPPSLREGLLEEDIFLNDMTADLVGSKKVGNNVRLCVCVCVCG